jgi:hypothetical protein
MLMRLTILETYLQLKKKKKHICQALKQNQKKKHFHQ